MEKSQKMKSKTVYRCANGHTSTNPQDALLQFFCKACLEGK